MGADSSKGLDRLTARLAAGLRADRARVGKFGRGSPWRPSAFIRLQRANAVDHQNFVTPMDRLAVTAILVVLLGVWVHPFLAGATAGPQIKGVAGEANPISTVDQTKPILPEVSNRSTLSGPISSAAFKSVAGQSGFWRLGQTHGGVWWFISPDNQPEFLNTVTTVQPYQLGRDKDGAHYVSRDYTPRDKSLAAAAANNIDDPDLDHWAQATIARLRGIGFKGIGAWSNPVFHKYDVPITRDLNVWSWMKPESKRFYSPGWAQTAEQAFQVQAAPLKESRALIGYFVDNEIDWGDDFVGPRVYFNELPSNDPNRAQVLNVVQSVWQTVEGFNKEWATSFKDWSELAAQPELPKDQPKAYDRLFSAWLTHLSEDYFRLTSQLLKKYDPNHLNLGVRFRGYAPREVVTASRGYTDAQSLNYYVSDARVDESMFTMMNEQSGQPVVISEYSFHALDGRSGDRNTVGFVGQVLDQQARADGYKLFTSRLARVPFVIGADWFQWSDEPASGRSSDGEDVNFGVVDITDHEYAPLAAAIGEVSTQLDDMHRGASLANAKANDAFRESFADRPTMHVPHLAQAPALDGDLSDWPEATKVAGIRHSQTVGLERSQLPLPTVRLGWTNDGLYLGAQVFDQDVEGTSQNGWWWTRDHIEFWLSTDHVKADQAYYMPSDHDFFVIPAADTDATTVGQWHRFGDALTAHVIPQPRIQKAIRTQPDRYTVELFIPAAALHGWNPAASSTLAFNIHIRNFQHATDYFWSAPKEVRTQDKPNTWGTIVLDGADAKSDSVAAK